MGHRYKNLAESCILCRDRWLIMREILRTRQDAANGRTLQTTWRVRHRRSQRDRESERERERGRGERETIAARHCTARLRACAYASELSFYLISAAAATLSRRLARAALYSLLPSRSDCAPLPPPPRVSLVRTRILGLFHFFICFTSSSLPLRLPVPLSSFSLPFFLAPRSPPFPHPISLSFLFLPFAISSFFPDPVSSPPPPLDVFPSVPFSTGVFFELSLRQHSLFKISANVNSVEFEWAFKDSF